MINKKPYIVPIPGSRKISRIEENGGAADIELTAVEIRVLDEQLDTMGQFRMFGGSPVKK